MRFGINTNPSAGGGRPAAVDQMIEQVMRVEQSGFATAAFAHLSGFDALTIISVAVRGVPLIELETAPPGSWFIDEFRAAIGRLARPPHSCHDLIVSSLR